MPRMACIATGRPTKPRAGRRACRSRAASTMIGCSKATCADLGGDPADRVGRDAAALGHGLGRVGRHRGSARPAARRPAARARPSGSVARAAEPRAARPCSAGATAPVSRRRPSGLPSASRAIEAVVGGAGRVDHQPAGVGAGGPDSRGRPGRGAAARGPAPGRTARPCRAGCRSTRRRSRSSRCAPGLIETILAPRALSLAEAELDRVAVVVLGDAEQQEVAGMLPVRLAELPEAAADRVLPGGRHVDRAEAAMRRAVRRAEAGGPQAGQRLALVAAGEEGELLGVGRADRRQPGDGERQRLVPGDLLELARAALADAQQRRAQPGRRLVLHDAGGALAADARRD